MANNNDRASAAAADSALAKKAKKAGWKRISSSSAGRWVAPDGSRWVYLVEGLQYMAKDAVVEAARALFKCRADITRALDEKDEIAACGCYHAERKAIAAVQSALDKLDAAGGSDGK